MKNSFNPLFTSVIRRQGLKRFIFVPFMPNMLVYFVSVVFFLAMNFYAYSQTTDSIKKASYFGGSVTLTNKGISSIPNLTLGKPAMIFFMSVGRKIRFEPEFRVALEGKPWMFIFWWRYDLVNTNRIYIKMRANTSLVFNTIPVTVNNVPEDILKSSRVLTGDLSSTYFLAKNFGVGPYYMYTYGIEKNAVRNTHYLAFRFGFSNIKISNQFFMAINPSVYYLKMDENHGYYSNATMTLSRRNFPLSFSALINKTIQTGIPIGENFLWNVSIAYSFNKKYSELK